MGLVIFSFAKVQLLLKIKLEIIAISVAAAAAQAVDSPTAWNFVPLRYEKDEENLSKIDKLLKISKKTELIKNPTNPIIANLKKRDRRKSFITTVNDSLRSYFSIFDDPFSLKWNLIGTSKTFALRSLITS